MLLKVLVGAGIVVAAGLMLTNIYTSMVDVKSWGAAIPRSVEVAREYFKVVNPGHFFRIFSPINQLLAIALLIASWKLGGNARLYAGIALAFALVAEGLTFKYFYPRNEIILMNNEMDIPAITKAIKEWTVMNWFRTLCVIIQLMGYFLVLNLIYTRQAQ